ncbi:hypothetical protein EUGRSUZ_D00867 [Eucalyptus grandis]|uniref:Uncharacterized protein n=2 Tax=Eucalyptus grandis TaxID=71139 RepID=A0ACC3L3T9_EUCGR|nr:hypothetical protein EUGRSUZ_D00867 [Eucalyptus grandis]
MIKVEKDPKLLDIRTVDALEIYCDHSVIFSVNHGEKDGFTAARMILSGIPLDETYLQNRLSILMNDEKKSLKGGRIPIPDSYYLMGTADPTGILKNKRTHCLPEAIVGVKIHDDLTVDPSLMKGNKSILDFRHFLDRAYQPRIKGSIQDKEQGVQLKLNQSASVPTLGQSMKINKDDQKHQVKKPKLVILSRSGSRALVNEDCLVKMAEDMGFRVEVSRPKRTTELAKMYRLLNKSEVMVGVHGAALTHFLFLKPGSVLIQVIPLGTDSPAETCFGKPARELGLKYIGYKISPRESSLYNEYDKDDPVLTNPKGVTRKGWQYTKEIYLDRQNVSLDMRRFHKRLLQAYDYSFKKINGQISYNQTTDLFKLC